MCSCACICTWTFARTFPTRISLTPASPSRALLSDIREACPEVEAMRLPRVREEEVGFGEEGRRLGMPKRPAWRGVVSECVRESVCVCVCVCESVCECVRVRVRVQEPVGAAEPGAVGCVLWEQGGGRLAVGGSLCNVVCRAGRGCDVGSGEWQPSAGRPHISHALAAWAATRLPASA